MTDTPETTPQRRLSLRGLLLFNAALLVVLAGVTFGPAAFGQIRIPGEYTMAAGGANGANASIVYVVDVRNQELMAITYDHNTKNMLGVGHRNLATDIANSTRRRPGN